MTEWRLSQPKSPMACFPIWHFWRDFAVSEFVLSEHPLESVNFCFQNMKQKITKVYR